MSEDEEMDDPSRKRLLIADRLGQDHHHTGGSPRDQALFALLLVSFSLSLLTIFIFIWRASFFFLLLLIPNFDFKVHRMYR